ncbi:MAG: hypothetical protein ACLUOA_08685 [Gemmiger formicilis]|uniref:hypothetical protein n=1 Tax=Gemmiger formicilis TaxID=745368 RepID=UPI003991FE73
MTLSSKLSRANPAAFHQEVAAARRQPAAAPAQPSRGRASVTGEPESKPLY